MLSSCSPSIAVPPLEGERQVFRSAKQATIEITARALKIYCVAICAADVCMMRFDRRPARRDACEELKIRKFESVAAEFCSIVVAPSLQFSKRVSSFLTARFTLFDANLTILMANIDLLLWLRNRQLLSSMQDLCLT